MSKCTRKALTAQAVEEAMEQHDGLVHAFIQRQGGGDISYEEALQAGRIVKLSGFGVFQVRAKRARMGRNPKTGEPAAIEPRRVIGFRASQVMKARVDEGLGD